MPKELTPKSRGLEPELNNFKFENKPESKNYDPDPVTIITPKEDTSSDKEDTSSETVYKKVIEYGKGYLIVDTNKGKIKYYNGTLAWRNNNPGNIKFGEFARSKGAIGKTNEDMSVFPTFEMGEEAQEELLFGPNSRYKGLTLQQTIYKYAPASDGNDPKEYTNFVSRKSGIPKNMVITKLSKDQKNKMLKAMHIIEGFKEGKVQKL